MIKYTKELLEPLVRESDSMAAVMKKLNLSIISGGMHAHLKGVIKRFNIDTSHWLGIASNRGKFIPRKENRDVLIRREGTIYKEKTKILLRAYLQAGKKYECCKCGLSKWQGKFLRLHIEHKNGDSMDNRIENLELLCPNCHSQTETYGIMKKNRAGNGIGVHGTGVNSGKLCYSSLTEKLVNSFLNKTNSAPCGFKSRSTHFKKE